MSPITIALIILFLGFIVNGVRFLYTGNKFIRHIKKNHPDTWDDLTNTKNIYKLLWPYGKGTPTYFIYKSKETLGDAKIEEFRKRIRQQSFSLFVIYPLSFLAFIIVVIWFLGKHNGFHFTFFWE